MGIIRFAMESGAKGVEIVVSGKIRAQRAKYMKFVDGFMIHSGEPNRVRILCLRCPAVRSLKYFVVATLKP